ncbi:RnfH family protein [Ectothiorhodospiraceae bacterium BW-2]|nr:RnfH family protein [Ectothiorhodospiraceae bacterium BW-2]
MTQMLQVEVVYALAQQQSLLTLEVEQGTTVEAAIHQSGVLQRHPDIDLQQNKIGIFSKATTLDQILRDRDRIEIYRPLIADPKQVRKERAAAGKKMKKGAGEE